MKCKEVKFVDHGRNFPIQKFKENYLVLLIQQFRLKNVTWGDQIHLLDQIDDVHLDSIQKWSDNSLKLLWIPIFIISY